MPTPGLCLHEITVTDGNGNDFGAFTRTPDQDKDVVAWVFIYGDNGFGVENGVSVITGLKKLPDGKFGA